MALRSRMLAALALVLVVGACGRRRGGGGGDDDDDDSGLTGSSGLPTDAYGYDLDTSEREQLCEWSADLFGGDGATQQCADGFEVSADVAECVDTSGDPSCNITVGQYEDCMNALDGDMCAILEATPPECGPFLSECMGADA